MLNLLKGFIIGIGKIIPGVSGSVLAITLGVYDKSVEYINNFKHNKKESLKYLLPLGIGIIISIIIFSKIITILLDKYYQITMLFFIGLIIGGLPEIIKKVKKQDNIIVGTSFIIFFIISISNLNSNYILKGNILDIIILFISGLLEAIGTVVPGVSSSALLMILGTYNIILSSIGNITSISVILTNIKIIIPFLLGVFLGIITLIKIIDYLLKKHENKLYSFVLGVLLSSIILLIIKVFKEKIRNNILGTRSFNIKLNKKIKKPQGFLLLKLVTSMEFESMNAAVKGQCVKPLHQLAKMVGLNGLEPSTSRLSGVRSNHLSYKPICIAF